MPQYNIPIKAINNQPPYSIQGPTNITFKPLYAISLLYLP